MAANPFYFATPKRGMVQIVNADSTNQKTVIPDPTAPAKVVSLIATSDDTADRTFQISILRSAANFLLGTVKVPLGSGTDGLLPSVDLLNAIIAGGFAIPGIARDNDGQPYIYLESGDALQVKALVAVTAAKTVAVHADYAK